MGSGGQYISAERPSPQGSRASSWRVLPPCAVSSANSVSSSSSTSASSSRNSSSMVTMGWCASKPSLSSPSDDADAATCPQKMDNSISKENRNDGARRMGRDEGGSSESECPVIGTPSIVTNVEAKFRVCP